LLRESNFVARQSNSNMIRIGLVEEAMKNQELRVSRFRVWVLETFLNGTTLILTEVSAIGQLNELSVLSTRDYMFGAPTR
ncbi:ATP-dependent protease, partial [Vibrio parahaemolyticus]